ncbi:hypothetical protein, partial [Nostoc sp. JL23]|uniref:hypothetical protein n=1 Tax=Nostoc sp. JL23 TaxID=2815394 RepID=UPI0025DDAB11
LHPPFKMIIITVGGIVYFLEVPKNRACSVWADKESILSLNDRTCTCINPRVQPLMSVIC